MKTKRYHEATQEEIKALSFQGMLRFREFCEAHSLSYTLMYGTLIGAARHQGFIPWDDDVDMAMPRTDYEELIRLWTEQTDPEWELLSYRTKRGYCLPWAKLCHKDSQVLPSRFSSGLVYGCAIDVFPLDYAPDAQEETERVNKELAETYRQKSAQYRCWDSLESGNSASLKRILKRIYFRGYSAVHGSWSRRLAEMDEMAANASQTSSRSQFIFMYDFDKICRWKTEDFGFEEPDGETLVFCGERFRVPKDYDRVLRAYYGDYMTFPPEEERMTRHTYTMLVLND